jgi:hypothetical protein
VLLYPNLQRTIVAVNNQNDPMSVGQTSVQPAAGALKPGEAAATGNAAAAAADAAAAAAAAAAKAGKAADAVRRNEPPQIVLEGWIARNIAPVLALLATVATFAMFGYFVHVARGPLKETHAYNEALMQLNLEKDIALKNIAASAPASQIAADKANIENKTANVGRAKLDLDDAKERLGMLKDFIIFILGVLSSTLTTIFGYYFGASKSGLKKDEAMQAIANRVG